VASSALSVPIPFQPNPRNKHLTPVKTIPLSCSVLRLAGLVAGFLSLLPIVSAQDGSTGTVEGHVSNRDTGNFLETVRISVDGTSTAAFTDYSGQFRLTNVPAGTVVLKAFRTGFNVETDHVTVGGGQTVQHDFSLTSVGAGATEADGTVKLDKFVVSESVEMSNAAVEINTKRFAPNIINVVSADQFGPLATGNVGEVIKSQPGIVMGLGGLGEPNTISIDGVPTAYVPVTFNSFYFASANGGTSRLIGIHQVSLNSVSRIEISYTPTPETPGSALAGTVNMVPRSSFEFSHQIYNLSASILMRAKDTTFSATPGPRLLPSHKVQPGVDFSAIVPINRRLGFTVAASTSPLYTEPVFAQNTWRGVSAATNGTTLPSTTQDNPYLTDYAVRDATRMTRHSAYEASLDYKLSPYDQIALTFNYALFDWESDDRTMTFFVNSVAPGNFGPTFTHGAVGAGEVRQASLGQNVHDILYMPTITYRHNGTVWTTVAGLGFSHSTRTRSDISDGIVANALVRRTGVTVGYDNIGPLGPKHITVTDATGAAVDPFNVSNYSIDSATGNEIGNLDLQKSAYANTQRSFSWLIPVKIKAGIDLHEAVRDVRMDLPSFTFTGPNKSASQVADTAFTPRGGVEGLPPIQWVSNDLVGALYGSNPQYFTFDPVARYKSDVGASQHIVEDISAAYLRTDTEFLNGRLKLVAGLRGEQTAVKGQGALVDPTRNYQRDGSGKIVLDATGKPVPITTVALDAVHRTAVDRAQHTNKDYLRLFPSVNASYDIAENLIARASYYQSVGRPDFTQYAGSLNLPDTSNIPSPTNVISVNNAGIKAWSAQTERVALEYYFAKIGLISISGYTRQFKNFFGTTVFASTPAFLAQYNIDPSIYGAYSVSTQYNVPGLVHMSGFDINYKQALTFLPDWAQGFQVFGNFTSQHLSGDVSDSLAGYTPRAGNFGIGFARPKYSVRVRANYVGRQRLGPVAPGQSIVPGTYNWNSQRTVTDVNAEYHFYRQYSVYCSLQNVSDAAVDAYVYAPNTPAYARFRNRTNFGAEWLFGIKGTF
jgi:iron complex outermembrane receptor protein